MALITSAFLLIILLVPTRLSGQYPSPTRRYTRRSDARRSDARTELGRLLFFDPALSANYKRSCASCHRPEKAFTDQRVRAKAFAFSENLPTNTPTVLNTAGQTAFFHDGRAGSIADVIQSVVTSTAEFSSSYALVLRRLRDSPDYQRLFRRAYQSGASVDNLNDALTTYIRSLTHRQTIFDQFQRGTTLLPDAAQRGYILFSQQLACGTCHPAPWFRDDRLHQAGSGPSIRTPGLRNVLQTPPYLHDGSAPTLDAVLETPLHRQHVGRLLTSAEQDNLRQFLATLTDSTSATEAPATLPFIRQAPARRIGGQY